MTELREVSTEELEQELKRRRAGQVCVCGYARVEVTQHNDDALFYPRKGCTNCNRWDGPVRVR